jgi:hypothetical protein
MPPTGGDTTVPGAPDESTPIAVQAIGEPQAASTSGDLAPMAIAVETVSANAVTLVILALLASGLALAGIDRSKRQATSGAEGEAEPSAQE